MAEHDRNGLKQRLAALDAQVELHARRHEIVQELLKADDPDLYVPHWWERLEQERQLKKLVSKQQELSRALKKLDRQLAEQQRAPKTVRDRLYDAVSTYEATKDEIAEARDQAAAWYRKHYAPNLPLPEHHRDTVRNFANNPEHALTQQNSLLRRRAELQEINAEWDRFWEQRAQARDARRAARVESQTARNERRREKKQQQYKMNAPENQAAERKRLQALEHELNEINRKISQPRNRERQR